MLVRKSSGETGQKLPGWAGFVSVTWEVPSNVTTIDYYPVIKYPITEFDTIQECPRAAEGWPRPRGWPRLCHNNIWLGRVHEGISSHLESSIKLQETHCVDWHFPFDLCILQDAWKENERIRTWRYPLGSWSHVFWVYERRHNRKELRQESALSQDNSGVLRKAPFYEFLSMNGKDDALVGIAEESKNIFQELIRSPTKERLAEVVANADLKALI